MEAREFAWNILNRTVSQEAFTGNLLREKRADMKEEDWNLALRIIYGTLSNRRYIRYQWEEFKRGKLSYDIMNLIDLSVYQRLFLDRIPAYAVLDEAIRLVKKENAKMAPVVNAILRNFERRGIKKLPEDMTEALALRTSVPAWLCGLWIAQYGEETGQKLCEDTLRIKPMWVRVKKETDLADFLKEYPGLREGKLRKGALCASDGKDAAKLLKDCRVAVQDEASQTVADQLKVKPGMKVLDMCASPGTKTLQIAEKLEGKGEVHAYDLYESRVRLLEKAVKAQGFGPLVFAKAYDARNLCEIEKEESFDAVLLDAPCSGLGVLKDKPDLKNRVTGKDLDDCAALQKELLKTAERMVRPGGTLVYSTCTLNKKENERQIAAFLKEFPGMKLEKERTVFPFEDENDGFYHAVMKKG